jgi:hypothetical protein
VFIRLEANVWKVTSRRKYWFALEILPPAYHDARGFLLGEPFDHAECSVTKTVLPRYEAYVRKKGRHYVSIRPLTIPEYKKAKVGKS